MTTTILFCIFYFALFKIWQNDFLDFRREILGFHYGNYNRFEPFDCDINKLVLRITKSSEMIHLVDLCNMMKELPHGRRYIYDKFMELGNKRACNLINHHIYNVPGLDTKTFKTKS